MATSTPTVAAPDNPLVDLVRKHEKALQDCAFACTGDPHAAEDLVQETMLHAWQHTDQIPDRAAMRPWLLTVLHNQILAMGVRPGTPTREMPAGALSDVTRLLRQQDKEPHSPDPAQTVVEHIATRDLLRGLPAAQSEVVRSLYLNEMTIVETAVFLDLPVATVKSRHDRALLHLRRRAWTQRHCPPMRGLRKAKAQNRAGHPRAALNVSPSRSKESLS